MAYIDWVVKGLYCEAILTKFIPNKYSLPLDEQAMIIVLHKHKIDNFVTFSWKMLQNLTFSWKMLQNYHWLTLFFIIWQNKWSHIVICKALAVRKNGKRVHTCKKYNNFSPFVILHLSNSFRPHTLKSVQFSLQGNVV